MGKKDRVTKRETETVSEKEKRRRESKRDKESEQVTRTGVTTSTNVIPEADLASLSELLGYLTQTHKVTAIKVQLPKLENKRTHKKREE